MDAVTVCTCDNPPAPPHAARRSRRAGSARTWPTHPRAFRTLPPFPLPSGVSSSRRRRYEAVRVFWRGRGSQRRRRRSSLPTHARRTLFRGLRIGGTRADGAPCTPWWSVVVGCETAHICNRRQRLADELHCMHPARPCVGVPHMQQAEPDQPGGGSNPPNHRGLPSGWGVVRHKSTQHGCPRRIC